MSIFITVQAECGKCGQAAEVQLAASVNADRRPDLRQAIQAGTFQAITCQSCGAALRLPVHLSYLDIARGQWLLVESVDRIADWQAAEAEALALFAGSYGPAAPPQARELGASLRPRLVFGWPALREKLLCQELDLDDTTLELLKMAVIRDVPGPPLHDSSELRLAAATPDTLTFTWVEAASEAELARLDVPRSLYEGVAADPAAWDKLRHTFDGRAFVDLRRMLLA